MGHSQPVALVQAILSHAPTPPPPQPHPRSTSQTPAHACPVLRTPTATPYTSDIGANLLDDMYVGQYNDKPYHPPDLDAVLSRAWAAGLQRLIITAGSLAEAKRALELAEKDGGWVWLSLPCATPCVYPLVLLVGCNGAMRYVLGTGRVRQTPHQTVGVCRRRQLCYGSV